MSFNRILVRFTFISMTCASFALAQRSEPPSNSSVGGQIVLSGHGGLKEPVRVLLDHFGSKNDQHTFTDLRGNFEFRNVPKGSYNIRVRLEGFENVNYPVDVPGTPYVFIFLNGSATPARGPDGPGGNHLVDIRQLTANIPKQALKEYEKAVREIKDHNTQRAIERLEKSIKLAPDFYNAHLGLGQEYRKTDRLDAAESELTRAFELNPREVTPLIQLGEIYLEKKKEARCCKQREVRFAGACLLWCCGGFWRMARKQRELFWERHPIKAALACRGWWSRSRTWKPAWFVQRRPTTKAGIERLV